MPHLAIIMQKIPAHSISIKCANATFFRHHVALCYQFEHAMLNHRDLVWLLAEGDNKPL